MHFALPIPLLLYSGSHFWLVFLVLEEEQRPPYSSSTSATWQRLLFCVSVKGKLQIGCGEFRKQNHKTSELLLKRKFLRSLCGCGGSMIATRLQMNCNQYLSPKNRPGT
jgi:hypothetical protein